MSAARKTTACEVGEAHREESGIVVFRVTLEGGEISGPQMMEANRAIDEAAGEPCPLLVDMSRSHSVSFAAMREMGGAGKVLAVALFAPPGPSAINARIVNQIQKTAFRPPYPFRFFEDRAAARGWLEEFLPA